MKDPALGSEDTIMYDPSLGSEDTIMYDPSLGSEDGKMKYPVLGSSQDFNESWPRRESHNCYSYLLNLTSTDAEKLCMVEYDNLKYCRRSQPGYAAGYGYLEKKDLKCQEVMKRTLADNPNIKPSSFEKKCDIDSYKGALVVDPGQDYHYYRFNDEGYWTHKAGYKPSSAYDASDKLILNPEKANRNYGRLNYSDFCGYFCVPRKSTEKRMYHQPLNKEKNSNNNSNKKNNNMNNNNSKKKNNNSNNMNNNNNNSNNMNNNSKKKKKKNKTNKQK